MPKTTVLFFREDDGSVPVDDWLDELQHKARQVVVVKIGLLGQFGHELRRPIADTLRDGIYEIRAKHGKLNLRILYFFHGREAIILAHGLTKQQAEVPNRDIDLAVARKAKFEADPKTHSFPGGGQR